MKTLLEIEFNAGNEIKSYFHDWAKNMNEYIIEGICQNQYDEHNKTVPFHLMKKHFIFVGKKGI